MIQSHANLSSSFFIFIHTGTVCFGKASLYFTPLKKQQTASSTCQVMTPVSWVNQASFEPLGLTLAIPKTPSVTEEVVVEPEVSIDPELHLEEILKDHPSIRTRSLAFDIF